MKNEEWAAQTNAVATSSFFTLHSSFTKSSSKVVVHNRLRFYT